MIGNSQQRIIKGKLCLSNLIAFCDEVTFSVMEGGALTAVCFDSSKAFDTVSHYLLKAKLVRYGLCKWMITWAENQLSHWAQRVVINNMKQNWRLAVQVASL